jgi:nucleotide-binding universal stress UspA family protein
LTLAHILCPVDFSEVSAHALEQATVVAGWYHAKITVLYVYTPALPTVSESFGVSMPADKVEPAKIQRLQETARAFAGPAIEAKREVDVVVDIGHPAQQILARASALGADMIVMGTHGASGFERLMLGSVAEKVVRRAGCPVLTVPPRAHSTSRLPFRRILCPIDFSPSSTAALPIALSLAQEAEAQLMLLHVLEWPIGHEPPPLPTFNVPEYRIYREKEAAAELEKMVPAAARDWCEPTTHLAHGKPYEQVLGFARDHDVDLIVIGVHGRSALDVALFGSTTNQVIRGATCPVLTLRR